MRGAIWEPPEAIGSLEAKPPTARGWKKSSLAAGGTGFQDFSIKKITQFKPILLKIYAFIMWHKK